MGQRRKTKSIHETIAFLILRHVTRACKYIVQVSVVSRVLNDEKKICIFVSEFDIVLDTKSVPIL